MDCCWLMYITDRNPSVCMCVCLSVCLSVCVLTRGGGGTNHNCNTQRLRILHGNLHTHAQQLTWEMCEVLTEGSCGGHSPMKTWPLKNHPQNGHFSLRKNSHPGQHPKHPCDETSPGKISTTKCPQHQSQWTPCSYEDLWHGSRENTVDLVTEVTIYSCTDEDLYKNIFSVF